MTRSPPMRRSAFASVAVSRTNCEAIGAPSRASATVRRNQESRAPMGPGCREPGEGISGRSRRSGAGASPIEDLTRPSASTRGVIRLPRFRVARDGQGGEPGPPVARRQLPADPIGSFFARIVFRWLSTRGPVVPDGGGPLGSFSGGSPGNRRRRRAGVRSLRRRLIGLSGV